MLCLCPWKINYAFYHDTVEVLHCTMSYHGSIISYVRRVFTDGMIELVCVCGILTVEDIIMMAPIVTIAIQKATFTLRAE